MTIKKAMNWGLGILGVIIGIYVFKWLNSQYKLPIVGDMIEGV